MSPQLFAVVTSITIITMVYVGGMASIYGAVGGALLLTLMTELLRDFGEWRLMIYSLVLIAILFFLPTGLVAPIWKKVRQRLAARSGDAAPQQSEPIVKDSEHRIDSKVLQKGGTI